MLVLVYIITHHPPLYEGDDQVAMAIQTCTIPLHSFNPVNSKRVGNLKLLITGVSFQQYCKCKLLYYVPGVRFSSGEDIDSSCRCTDGEVECGGACMYKGNLVNNGAGVQVYHRPAKFATENL